MSRWARPATWAADGRGDSVGSASARALTGSPPASVHRPGSIRSRPPTGVRSPMNISPHQESQCPTWTAQMTAAGGDFGALRVSRSVEPADA
jgi:hypothetical protein